MTHSTHAHSAEAEVARVRRQSAVIRVRAATAAIMIALRCRPARVSCRCLAYVEATPNAWGTRWGPRGRRASSSPLSLKPFQDEDQLAEDGAVILPLERMADLLRVADI